MTDDGKCDTENQMLFGIAKKAFPNGKYMTQQTTAMRHPKALFYRYPVKCPRDTKYLAFLVS